MNVTVIIALEIKGEAADAFAVVDKLLDEGLLQEAINDHEFDDGPLEVVKAISRANGLVCAVEDAAAQAGNTHIKPAGQRTRPVVAIPRELWGAVVAAARLHGANIL